MENERSNVGPPSAVKSQLSKYLFKDPETGQTKCRICKASVRNSGFLRIHLEKIHLVQFNLEQTPDRSAIQTVSYPPNQSEVKPTQKPRYLSQPMHNSNDRKDWLNPFLEQVSQPSQQEVEQHKDQYKYLISSTQFTQPLKYFEFNRYLDEQITEIKQQLSQLTCLKKIPPMVTMEEKDIENQQEKKKDKHGIERLRNFFKLKMEEVRMSYDIFEWKHESNQIELKEIGNVQQLKEKDINENQQAERKQENQIQNQSEKDSVNKYQNLLKSVQIKPENQQLSILQQLTSLNFTLTHIQKQKKQNVPPSTLSIPPQNPKTDQNNPQPQISPQEQPHIPQNNVEEQCQIYILSHAQWIQIYQKYGDALCIIGFGVGDVGVILLGVQNWRLQFQVVGVIVIRNVKQVSSSTLQSTIAIYFNTLNTALPKSITLLHPPQLLALKQPVQNFINSLPQSTPKPHIIAVTQQHEPIPPIKQQFTNLYNQFISRVSGIIDKYHGSDIGNIDIQLISTQKQLHQQIDNGELYLDGRNVGFIGYHGLYQTHSNIDKYMAVVQSIKDRVLGDNSANIGVVLYHVLKALHENYVNQVAGQIQAAINPNNTHQHKLVSHLQGRVSNNIYNILIKIADTAQHITHIKYLAPNNIEVYSIFPHNPPGQAPQPSLQQCCSVFKNTLIFNQLTNCWYCNCNKLAQVGLPCYHLLKIVGKMGGSVEYYVHDRWKPSGEELRVLDYDHSTWNQKNAGEGGKNDGNKEQPVMDIS